VHLATKVNTNCISMYVGLHSLNRWRHL